MDQPENEIPEQSGADYGDDLRIVEVDGRSFFVIGTAHISRESAELVRRVIEVERPDRVCIELDEKRYEALTQEQGFNSLDLKQIIRQKQLAALILNLMLVSYQRRMGLELGVTPGTELLEAARTAEACGIPISLCDRDIRVTLRRAWAAMPWWHKLTLVPSVVASLFEKPELSEEDLRQLRNQDVGSQLIEEIGQAFPAMKGVLIDERDAFLAQKIRDSPGDRVVAVVGAGHVPGLLRVLEKNENVALDELNQMPPVAPWWKVLGWGIPALILCAIGYIGWSKGSAAAGENLLFWTLANGIPAMLGAVVAFGHPGTIVASFFAAPITSLTPVIGAGYVSAFVQSYLTPPIVREFHTVADDISSPAQWWKNRLLRVFLVFLFTTLGSLLGTFVGGAEILSNLF